MELIFYNSYEASFLKKNYDKEATSAYFKYKIKLHYN